MDYPTKKPKYQLSSIIFVAWYHLKVLYEFSCLHSSSLSKKPLPFVLWQARRSKDSFQAFISEFQALWRQTIPSLLGFLSSNFGQVRDLVFQDQNVSDHLCFLPYPRCSIFISKEKSDPKNEGKNCFQAQLSRTFYWSFLWTIKIYRPSEILLIMPND